MAGGKGAGAHGKRRPPAATAATAAAALLVCALALAAFAAAAVMRSQASVRALASSDGGGRAQPPPSSSSSPLPAPRRLKRRPAPRPPAAGALPGAAPLLPAPAERQGEGDEDKAQQGSSQPPPARSYHHYSAGRPARFYIDEGFFLAGETEVLRAHVAASDGRLVVSGESSAAFLSVKGYYVPDKWDVYITIRQACEMAFPLMRAGQRSSCVPGVRAVTLKQAFVLSWQRAFGERAFDFIPRSYALPEQYQTWRAHLAQVRGFCLRLAVLFVCCCC